MFKAKALAEEMIQYELGSNEYRYATSQSSLTMQYLSHSQVQHAPCRLTKPITLHFIVLNRCKKCGFVLLLFTYKTFHLLFTTTPNYHILSHSLVSIHYFYLFIFVLTKLIGYSMRYHTGQSLGISLYPSVNTLGEFFLMSF